MDEAPDRAAQGASGLPADAVPGGAERLVGAPRRLVVPPGRPQDDGPRLGEPGLALARRLLQRRRADRPDPVGRARAGRLLPADVQRELRAGGVPCARQALRRALGAGAVDVRAGAGARLAHVRRPGRGAAARRARSSFSAARERAPGDLSPAVDTGVRLRGGARGRAVPARARRVASLPLARAGGPRGVDARLRRRRSDPRLGAARRRGGVARALLRRAWA